MDEIFDEIEARMLALRMTPTEVIAAVEPAMSYVTYWRAKSGSTKKNSTRTKVARRVEETLDRLEAQREKCSLCGKVKADLPARGCEEFGCPIRA